MEHTQIATAHRDPFMRAVEHEMAQFERLETLFRKKDWQERAAELRADFAFLVGSSVLQQVTVRRDEQFP